MAKKKNKIYYLNEETISKIESLSKKGNCKNTSNYLDELISKQTGDNKALEQTEKEMLSYLIQNLITRDSFNQVISQINNWMNIANSNFTNITKSLDKLAVDEIPSPSVDSRTQKIFNDLGMENYRLRLENESYQKSKQKLDSIDEISEELEEKNIAFLVYRAIAHNKNNGKLDIKKNESEIKKLKEIDKQNPYAFIVACRKLLKDNGIQLVEQGHSAHINHFRTRTEELLK